MRMHNFTVNKHAQCSERFVELSALLRYGIEKREGYY